MPGIAPLRIFLKEHKTGRKILRTVGDIGSSAVDMTALMVVLRIFLYSSYCKAFELVRDNDKTSRGFWYATVFETWGLSLTTLIALILRYNRKPQAEEELAVMPTLKKAFEALTRHELILATYCTRISCNSIVIYYLEKTGLKDRDNNLTIDYALLVGQSASLCVISARFIKSLLSFKEHKRKKRGNFNEEQAMLVVRNRRSEIEPSCNESGATSSSSSEESGCKEVEDFKKKQGKIRAEIAWSAVNFLAIMALITPHLLGLRCDEAKYEDNELDSYCESKAFYPHYYKTISILLFIVAGGRDLIQHSRKIFKLAREEFGKNSTPQGGRGPGHETIIECESAKLEEPRASSISFASLREGIGNYCSNTIRSMRSSLRA